MLTADAQRLVWDIEEIAHECASCFAGARCAGLDVPAIGQTAKAAVILGAPLAAVQAQVPATPADSVYLDQIEEIRQALAAKVSPLQQFIRGAAAVKREAAAGMARAIRDRDPGAYAYWLHIWLDAVRALQIAGSALRSCQEAGRCLRWARARFAQAYEGTESDVAHGVQLPHNGRWVTVR